MDIYSLPSDAVMLMSYINTKLRDVYPSLDELCDDLHIDKEALTEKLAGAGFKYSPEYNRFW